jgi:hypothetical protein
MFSRRAFRPQVVYPKFNGFSGREAAAVLAFVFAR